MVYKKLMVYLLEYRIPVTLAIQEVDLGGWRFEVSQAVRETPSQL
jgi:hypothetical protein